MWLSFTPFFLSLLIFLLFHTLCHSSQPFFWLFNFLLSSQFILSLPGIPPASLFIFFIKIIVILLLCQHLSSPQYINGVLRCSMYVCEWPLTPSWGLVPLTRNPLSSRYSWTRRKLSYATLSTFQDLEFFLPRTNLSLFLSLSRSQSVSFVWREYLSQRRSWKKSLI